LPHIFNPEEYKLKWKKTNYVFRETQHEAMSSKSLNIGTLVQKFQ